METLTIAPAPTIHQRRPWLKRLVKLLLICLAVAVAMLTLNSGLKHRPAMWLLTLPWGPHVQPVAADTSTDVWVINDGFVDANWKVIVARRWSLAPEVVMEAGSQYGGGATVVRRKDGRLWALRHGDYFVDHYDPSRPDEHGPRTYTLEATYDTLRYDREIRDRLGSDWYVVWSNR